MVTAQEEMMSSLEQNKEVAISFFSEGITNQNFDVITRVLSPMYSYNGTPSSVADNKAWVIGLHQTYPGLAFQFEAILAEGDMVAFRWRMTAPASGARPAGYTTGSNIITVADGQILTNWQNGTMSDSWTPAPAKS
jgi:predicted ester cyclase